MKRSVVRGLLVVLLLLPGAFTVVSLIFRRGFGLSFGVTFTSFLNVFEDIVDYITQLAEPFVSIALENVRRLFRFDLQLQEHWKYLFVLLLLYFWREMIITFRNWRVGSGVLLGFMGGTVALVASVAAGSIPLNPDNWTANFLIAAVPITGVFVYEAGTSLWKATTWWRPRKGNITWSQEFSRRLLNEAGSRWIAGLAIAAGFPVILQWLGSNVRSPGIASLYIYMTVLAAWWLLVGEKQARERESEPGQTWWSAFRHASTAQVGLAMFNTIVLAILATVVGKWLS